ncbi:MAG: hypothetical protein KC496_02845, partial [Anaerolineae bacterium]|nr:hypothetical protein [Anaerolineae bacterium]
MSTQDTETRRLSRRIALAVALVAMLPILIGIATVILNRQALLATEHQSELGRITHELEHALELYQHDLLELASLAPPQIFSLEDAQVAASNNLTRDAQNLLTQNQQLYEVIAYLDTSGQPHAYLENLDGMVSERIGSNTAFLPLDFAAISDALLALTPGETYVDVVVNAQGLNRIDLFTLVRQEGAPAGIVYLSVSPSQLPGIMQAESSTLNQDAQDRWIVWLRDETTLVAQNIRESLPQDRTWLQVIERVNSESPLPYSIRATQGYVLSGETFAIDAANNPAWQLIIVDQWMNVYGGGLLAISLIVLLGVGSAIIATQGIQRMIIPYLQRINETESLIRRVAGAPQESIPLRQQVIESSASNVPVADTIEELANRIKSLTDDVAERTARRERDLLMAGRIGRETATQRDLDTLVRHAINMICTELGVYHAQVFLLDPSKTYAELRYSRGEAGDQLLAAGHRLAVGSQTVVGRSSGERRPVMV